MTDPVVSTYGGRRTRLVAPTAEQVAHAARVDVLLRRVFAAERRAGELLIASRENGERVGFDGKAGSSSKARLDDLGVSKHESSAHTTDRLSRRDAAAPADEFEREAA